MKMKRSILFVSLAIMSIGFFTSCGGSKDAAKGDVEIVVPCGEYMSDGEYFRASAMGLSTDMNVAKKKAMTSARQEIAANVETRVKAVVDHYITSFQNGEVDDTKQKYQDMTRVVVKQKLNGLNLICNKVLRSQNGNYKVFVAFELSRAGLMEGMVDAIKADDKLRVDFEYEKFKEIFNEEMGKLQ